MSRSNGEHRHFRIECPDFVAEKYLQLYQEALERGEGKRLLAATRKIMRRLTEDADEFGEPTADLPAVGQQMRIGGIDGVLVRYAVHFVKRFVFIREFTMISRGTAP